MALVWLLITANTVRAGEFLRGIVGPRAEKMQPVASRWKASGAGVFCLLRQSSSRENSAGDLEDSRKGIKEAKVRLGR